MNDPSVSPQEVFRSHLPVGTSLIVIFVPRRDRGGQPIDQEYRVDEALTTSALSELYRTLSRMGRQPNHGEMGVVMDGKYYGITEDAEE